MTEDERGARLNPPGYIRGLGTFPGGEAVEDSPARWCEQSGGEGTDGRRRRGAEKR